MIFYLEKCKHLILAAEESWPRVGTFCCLAPCSYRAACTCPGRGKISEYLKTTFKTYTWLLKVVFYKYSQKPKT